MAILEDQPDTLSMDHGPPMILTTLVRETIPNNSYGNATILTKQRVDS